MIDWNVTKLMPSKYDGVNRTFVKIVCDYCSKERWETITNAKQLLDGGNMCISCKKAKENESKSIYKDYPGAKYIKGLWNLLAVCPDCGKKRYIRPTAKSQLCRSCACRKRAKIGIQDENGKTCPRCKEYKTYNKFWKNKNNHDGFSINCIECLKEKQQKRGENHWIRSHLWRDVLEKYGNKCLCCGKTNIKLQVDHVVPVILGGKSEIDNIQPLCGSCNVKKGGRYIEYRPDKLKSVVLN